MGSHETDRPTDYQGFKRFLLSVGAVHRRTTATHEQWRLPNGHNFTLPAREAKSDWAVRGHNLNRWRDLQKLLKIERGLP